MMAYIVIAAIGVAAGVLLMCLLCMAGASGEREAREAALLRAEVKRLREG